jgi:hypothetical protein
MQLAIMTLYKLGKAEVDKFPLTSPGWVFEDKDIGWLDVMVISRF